MKPVLDGTLAARLAGVPVSVGALTGLGYVFSLRDIRARLLRPLAMRVHAADVQDQDGAPDVIVDLLRRAATVSKLFADGGYQGPKLRAALKELGVSNLIEIVKQPKDAKDFTVLYRRWVAERTFSWMGRCRRLGKDFERTVDSTLAWSKLAACRFLMRRIARELAI